MPGFFMRSRMGRQEFIALSTRHPQIALRALATLAFWTAAGPIVGGAGGFVVVYLLFALFPHKPESCGLTDGIIGGAFILSGCVLGLIAGFSHATRAVRRKYGPGWRDRIRNPDREQVVSSENNPPSAH
jgi:hypothetical protein